MDLRVLPLSSQYIFSILLFMVNNWEYFTPNSIYHNNNTRQWNDLHLPQVTLATYQKGVYYLDTNIFSALPKTLKDISNMPNKFKTALKHFLHIHSFYSSDEFYNSDIFHVVCIQCISFICIYFLCLYCKL